MVEATARFFDDLGQRGHDPRLEEITARLRFDVSDGDAPGPWLVVISGGDVVVTREEGDADLYVRGSHFVFDDVFSGKANPMAAILRGALTFEGNPAAIGPFQRLFPGPEHSSHPRAVASAAGRPA